MEEQAPEAQSREGNRKIIIIAIAVFIVIALAAAGLIFLTKNNAGPQKQSEAQNSTTLEEQIIEPEPSTGEPES